MAGWRWRRAARLGRAAGGGARGGAPRLWLVPGTERLFTPLPLDAQPPPRREIVPETEHLPIGTPLRPRREPAAPGRAARALATARAFVVDTTTVGKPAQRARAQPRGLLLQPRLIALAAALLVLALLVSRVLPSNATAEREREAALAALPTLQPVTAASEALSGPASVPEPRGFQSYLVVAGDSLASIAERTGSDPGAIAALNRLAPGAALRPGRPLVVPVYHDGEPLPSAPIINRGNPERPLVALTFDIEIDDTTLYAILDILDARQVKGTFFVTGNWAQRYPEAAKAIASRGHELANHSLTHPAFSTIGADGALNELAETERIVRELTGASTRPYFRFPYGDSTPQMVETIGRAGYIAYHWSADDVAIASWIAQAAADPARANGGILLMHGRASSVAALAGYIDQLLAIGLQPTTLSAVLE